MTNMERAYGGDPTFPAPTATPSPTCYRALVNANVRYGKRPSNVYLFKLNIMKT